MRTSATPCCQRNEAGSARPGYAPVFAVIEGGGVGFAAWLADGLAVREREREVVGDELAVGTGARTSRSSHTAIAFHLLAFFLGDLIYDELFNPIFTAISRSARGFRAVRRRAAHRPKYRLRANAYPRPIEACAVHRAACAALCAASLARPPASLSGRQAPSDVFGTRCQRPCRHSGSASDARRLTPRPVTVRLRRASSLA